MQETAFKPRNPDYESRIQKGFETQEFLMFLGAELTGVGAGSIEVSLPYQKQLTQQHGFFHGGVVGTLADVGGGFAAFTLMAAADAILTVEYKVNMMAPALGEVLIARGRVLRPGRQLTVAQTDVFCMKDGVEKLCATSLGTFMTMTGLAEGALGY